MIVLKLYTLVVVVLISSNLFSQSYPILMEGEFSDWDSISFIYSDSIGDVPSGGVDFGGLKAANDGEFLYLYIELNYEVNLQSELNSTLFLDSDNNASTGLSIDGIGAELEWNFAAKSGKFYFGGAITVISQIDLKIITSPTVSSETFEISLELASRPDGTNLLFAGSEISVLLKDNDSGDVLPELGENVLYQIEPVIGVPFDMIGLVKNDSQFLRFMTWNIRRDDLFEPSLFDEYSRILKAIDPDIITFQEVYDHNSEDLKTLMESILPSEEGEEWFTFREANDIALASRYNIIGNWLPSKNSGNRAFLIDLSPVYTKNLLVVGVHPPCCANDAGRQNEVDAMMAFLREEMQGGGAFQLDPGTPVIFAGDFNFVGDKRQLETMLTGDIMDNATWGADFAPDWDGTLLRDAVPRHSRLSQTYTWQNEFSPFSPGRLDFIIFTDSAIDMEKSYVLRTEEMIPDSLSKYGLLSEDTRLASDHLPVVADFYLQLKDIAVDGSVANLPMTLRLEQNYPNPFNPSTQIGFFLELGGRATLNIYDTHGREVAELLDSLIEQGFHSIVWNPKDIASGIYFYRLSSGGRTVTKKMLLLK